MTLLKVTWFFKLSKIIKNSIDAKSTKICNAIPIWHYAVTEDIQHEYSAGAAPCLLQVRQPQCTGMAFRNLHKEKRAYMYDTWHRNT